MRNPFAPGVGGVLSGDIAVPEHDKELRFYSQVLTTGKSPLWREDLMNNLGQPIIGLGKRLPEYDALPMQWMPHIQVADVGVSAARAVELGGTELMHGRDADGRSQWAVMVDPSRAAFGLIPVVSAEVETDGVGHIAWLSLSVSDVASARVFYEEVIGWSAAAAAGDGVEMARPDGGVSAEIGPETSGVPSVWIMSLPVGDLEESLRRASELGGQIVSGSAEARRAVIKDPVGAYIGLQDSP